jgi:hypothetical protein
MRWRVGKISRRIYILAAVAEDRLLLGAVVGVTIDGL